MYINVFLIVHNSGNHGLSVYVLVANFVKQQPKPNVSFKFGHNFYI